MGKVNSGIGLVGVVVVAFANVGTARAQSDELPRGLRESISRTLVDEGFPSAAAAFDTEVKITASDAAASDQFGWSVAISGDTAIVGAPDVFGSAFGSAYVYRRDQGGVDNWGEVTKITPSDAAAGDFFGISVAISGDTAIVGGRSDDNDNGADSGSAYVYRRDEGGVDNWGEVTKITASDGAAGDRFGSSVAISGDTAIVGAYFDDDDGAKSGSAYMYRRDEGGVDNWGEVTKITASDGAADDFFGSSVAISGDTAIVGARRDDDNLEINSGSAYVYRRDEGGVDNWGEVTKITASDGAAGDHFGYSVAISGDTAVVGAIGDDDNGSNSGSAYLYFGITAVCTPAPPGLVSWWPLNETSGTTAADIVDGNPGTHINGPTPVLGKVAGALSFDGVDDYVRIPDSANLNPGTGDFSIDFWIKTTHVPTTSFGGNIISKRSICGFTSMYDIRLGGTFVGPPGTILVELSEPGGVNFHQYWSTITVNDGLWHHVAVTRQGPTSRLYIDGALNNSTTNGITNISNSSDILVGNGPCVGVDGTTFFDGELDEIQYFNVALTSAQVQGIFDAGSAGKCPCTDNDGDGYGSPGSASCPNGAAQDCDDTNAAINPGATEICDGVDNDCDTLIDEDFPDLGDACTVGVGECEESGTNVCTGGGSGTECDATPGVPVAEVCTGGVDEDCDGDVDCDDADCDVDPACAPAIPSVSNWGLSIAALMLFTGITLLCRLFRSTVLTAT